MLGALLLVAATPLAAAADTPVPRVSVSATSDLAPKEAKITVSGTAFDPAYGDGKGYGVRVGPQRTGWRDRAKTNFTQYSKLLKVENGGIQLNQDGTWQTELSVDAEYTAADGEQITAAKEQYYLMIFPWNNPDTSLDIVVPLNFKGITVPPPVEGALQWGLKSSWRNYVDGGGTITPSQGANFDTAGTQAPYPYIWSFRTATYDPRAGKGEAQYAGKVSFAFEQHMIWDYTLANPKVVFTPDGKGVLYVTVSSAFLGTKTQPEKVFGPKELAYADLEFDGKPTVSGRNATVKIKSASLTEDGAASFAGQGGYKKGTQLDTGTVSFSADMPSGCEANGKYEKGNLLWGFKRSFRGYVGGGKGNSIVGSDGAVVTDLDVQTNPNGVTTGVHQYPFRAATYTSDTKFETSFGGAITFSYPAHQFTIVLANPRVVADGAVGSLFADVELKVAEGGPGKPTKLVGVELAKLDFSTAKVTSAEGVLTVSGIASTLASDEAFAGFYGKGEKLDDLTVRIGAACATVPTTPPANPPAGCEANGKYEKGNKLWGFKRSFRNYIGGSKDNSIIGSDGAVVTDVDVQANANGVATGVHQYPFKAATYTSNTKFDVSFGGAITFTYPAHKFSVVLANPRVVADGNGGSLFADVELEAGEGAPGKPTKLVGVELAKLDFSTAKVTSAEGVLTVSGIASTLASAEAFAGFYVKGEKLDDLTVRIGAACATVPSTPPTTTPPPTGCEANGKYEKGNLLWGFKRSFRGYVGGGKGNGIVGSDGAVVTDVDVQANANGVATGVHQYPFKAATYTSNTKFDVSFGGAITFTYPGHKFSVVLANPRVVADGNGGSLFADVELKAGEGAPGKPTKLTGVELAKLNFEAAKVTSADGVLTVSGIASTLASAEAFAGFYVKGDKLDDLTVRIGAACATVPSTPPTTTPPPTDPPTTDPPTTNPPTTNPPTTNPPTGCEANGKYEKGNLLWGFKQSFRNYVGGGKGNSIIGSDGAVVTDVDVQANPNGVKTGLHQYPFKSTTFTSNTKFDVSFGGTITFTYPAHQFSVVLANPRVVADGKVGSVFADVELKAGAGAPGKPTKQTGVELAKLNFEAAKTTSANGVLTVTGVASTLASDEAFAGYYGKGEKLDELTVTLGAACSSLPAAGNSSTGGGSGGGGGASGSSDDLVPPLNFRPQGKLANTGAAPFGLVAMGTLFLLSGASMVYFGRRVRRS
nr:hypothetical protein [Kibdelosporangium sp. MJ126-NF4]CTQ89447.1 hypothetical protein [Kibdelosporangium sp. MJ126-NF4]